MPTKDFEKMAIGMLIALTIARHIRESQQREQERYDWEFAKIVAAYE